VPCQYFYDGSSNRLKAIRNSITTKYIHDTSGNLLAEADENNTILRYYIYGKGLTAMVTSSGDLYCYHFDANANTIAMTDTGQNIVNAYAYTPFGLIANEQETIEQPFKFVGQFGVMTEPDGFYYMRMRYYDPQVGRFISEDPLGFGGGDLNLYQYAHANPIMFMDPWGLCSGYSYSWGDFAIDAASAALAAADLLLGGPTGEGIVPAMVLQGMKSGAIQVAKGSLKKLSKGEIKKMAKKGIHPHDLKPKKGGARFALFKDKQGNITVRPKSGKGHGDPTSLNINDF